MTGEGLRGPMPSIRARGAWCTSATASPPTTSPPPAIIAEASPAGQYLKSLGVKPADFNSYGSRRGNDRVMTRGTFANVRVKNKLTGVAMPGDPPPPHGGQGRLVDTRPLERGRREDRSDLRRAPELQEGGRRR